jgi:hypothetical protein
MDHRANAYYQLEISTDELRAVVGYDAREYRKELLLGTLDDDLHIRFGHALTDLPVRQIPSAAVYDRTRQMLIWHTSTCRCS